METMNQTCIPSASFVTYPSLSAVPARGTAVPAAGVRVDVVRERIAADGIKVSAFAGDRVFGLAHRPRSVPV
jgi:hypothetical protein